MSSLPSSTAFAQLVEKVGTMLHDLDPVEEEIDPKDLTLEIFPPSGRAYLTSMWYTDHQHQVGLCGHERPNSERSKATSY